MGVLTASKLPVGVEALLRYIEDESLTGEERARVMSMAENLAVQSHPFEPRGSRNSWVELIYSVTSTTTISATATETIMVPDFPLAANYLSAGRCVRWTLIGDMSSAITTPGTWTQRLRYGGVGGTIVGVGNAFAPDTVAAATTVPFVVEWWLNVRADGTSGSVWCQGRQMIADYSATVASLNSQFMPASAPAAVTVNTTVAGALSPTSQASLTTGSLRTYMAFLEVLN
jgi:hypothetical protein